MIFITAKFKIRPEDADRWPQIAADFTEATRKEPGCLWFEWSRSLSDPEEYVLVEAFRDDQPARRTSPPSTSGRRSGNCRRIWRTRRGLLTSRSRRTTGPC
jgi:Antibiotic biosynthesis monooxygenase